MLFPSAWNAFPFSLLCAGELLVPLLTRSSEIFSSRKHSWPRDSQTTFPGNATAPWTLKHFNTLELCGLLLCSCVSQASGACLITHYSLQSPTYSSHSISGLCGCLYLSQNTVWTGFWTSPSLLIHTGSVILAFKWILSPQVLCFLSSSKLASCGFQSKIFPLFQDIGN